MNSVLLCMLPNRTVRHLKRRLEQWMEQFPGMQQFRGLKQQIEQQTELRVKQLTGQRMELRVQMAEMIDEKLFYQPVKHEAMQHCKRQQNQQIRRSCS